MEFIQHLEGTPTLAAQVTTGITGLAPVPTSMSPPAIGNTMVVEKCLANQTFPRMVNFLEKGLAFVKGNSDTMKSVAQLVGAAAAFI
jgi:hypothetical protein